MTTIWQKTKNRYDPKQESISPAEAETQREAMGKTLAEEALTELMDLVGDDKAREMTDDIEGTWWEIFTEINELTKAFKIVDANRGRIDKFLEDIAETYAGPTPTLNSNKVMRTMDDPRTDEQRNLDEWQAETYATRDGDYPI
jgi:hypothetical protein